MSNNKTTIISLGGSLIAPKAGIDVNFLKKFRALIIKQVKLGKKFIIIAGGGQTNRDYINAAKKITKPTNNELDWLGIYATHINALLIKTIFGNLTYEKIIKDPTKKISTNKPIIVGGGYEPGNSSDFVAVILAKQLNIKNIINLSNIDYVYDRDPNKYNDAKKIEKINWKDFRKIVGDKWSPRLSSPFDPIASRDCDKLNIKVAIMNGKNIDNLKLYLIGNKKFRGTVVSN